MNRALHTIFLNLTSRELLVLALPSPSSFKSVATFLQLPSDDDKMMLGMMRMRYLYSPQYTAQPLS